MGWRWYRVYDDGKRNEMTYSDAPIDWIEDPNRWPRTKWHEDGFTKVGGKELGTVVVFGHRKHPPQNELYLFEEDR